jgi:DNA-binding NarL/FixJ family response regulator
MIRILLVDNHPLVRRTIRTLLERNDGIDVVGEAKDGVEAVEQAAVLKPDVVVMDVKMPQMDGLQATKAIRAHQPKIGVVLISMYSAADLDESIHKVGAAAFVSKAAVLAELLPAVRMAAGDDQPGTLSSFIHAGMN